MLGVKKRMLVQKPNQNLIGTLVRGRKMALFAKQFARFRVLSILSNTKVATAPRLYAIDDENAQPETDRQPGGD